MHNEENSVSIFNKHHLASCLTAKEREEGSLSPRKIDTHRYQHKEIKVTQILSRILIWLLRVKKVLQWLGKTTYN